VVLQPKTKLGGHPLIFGRPWLAREDAFICCRSGSMTISNGYETKQLTLYPHATPLINNDNFVWVDFDDQLTKPISLLHIVKIPTFYLRRYGQNCPYCRKIEEIYKKKKSCCLIMSLLPR
jgi:hypothetical protein